MSVHRLVDRLLTCGEHLPHSLRTEVLACDEAVVPALIAVLEDRSLWRADAPGVGWAPNHAATLLGLLNAEAAIPALIDVLREAKDTAYISAVACTALEGIGAAALEPLLEAVGPGEVTADKLSLLGALVGLGLRDDRIFDALTRGFEAQPMRCGALFVDYGDRSALPIISARLDALFDSGDVTGQQTYAGALKLHMEELGGQLTPRQEAALASTKRSAGRSPASRPKTPGRNDPCWCGSGKKYKRCHL